MSGTFVLGIDLAGPSNRAATAAALFSVRGEDLECRSLHEGLDDRDLADLLETEVPAEAGLIAGLDAPLSYNPGGGDRPGDCELRRRLVASGLSPGTVMVPTMSRMVYLTLRGVVIARLLAVLRPGCRVVEVHPAGALVLRGAPVADIHALKKSAKSRHSLLAWLGDHGLDGLPATATSDHAVAACAAALAAWQWQRGQSCWTCPADPPVHPFDFAC
jgi:predicted nuclease with RNAse H fold